MLKSRRFILLIFIVILFGIIGYLFIPLPTYVLIDCYSYSPTNEITRITKELDGELSNGIYNDSKEYNGMNSEQDICWFLIEYSDTRLGLFRSSVLKKCRAEINTMFPGVIAKLSYGRVNKDGFLVEWNDPYGEAAPPWRWEN